MKHVKHVIGQITLYSIILSSRKCGFLASFYIDVRYWYSKSVCPSNRPSVRNVPVSDENGLTYRHSFLTIR